MARYGADRQGGDVFSDAIGGAPHVTSLATMMDDLVRRLTLETIIVCGIVPPP